MRVILFFIDGLGLGPAGADNPLSTTPTPCIDRLLGGRRLTSDSIGVSTEVATLYALDATLGVPGLPQSATGQTTLFTGQNAARVEGRHVSGFPTERLRKLLQQEGILKKILVSGKKPVFFNGYRPEFYTELAMGSRCFAATTLLNLYAGLPFHSFADMAAGRSLYSDITNEVLQEMGFEVPYVSPEAAGKTLAQKAADCDFLLFEYFLTDLVAHQQDRTKAAQCITLIDRFIGSIVAQLDLTETLFMLTSDHGNLEDLSTKNHTSNYVPCLLAGAGHRRPTSLLSLEDVSPLILRYLKE